MEIGAERKGGDDPPAEGERDLGRQRVGAGCEAAEEQKGRAPEPVAETGKAFRQGLPHGRVLPAQVALAGDPDWERSEIVHVLGELALRQAVR